MARPEHSRTSNEPSPTRLRPWRSAAAGWSVAGVALVVGVPLFLCMPPWVDVTLYDMAVRSILRGGVYYRDVFDTNLPGISWAMAVVRFLFGWSYVALRAVDLLVIAAEVALLIGWARKAGATNYAVAWLAAAAALFYPYTSEFNHVQRDGWMLLPALVAARLRLRRVEGAISFCPGTAGVPPALSQPQAAAETAAVPGENPGSQCLAPLPHKGGGHERCVRFVSTVLEGLAWGAAVWFKPHVVVPAFAVWLASAVLLARRESPRRVLADLGALVLGGALAGAAGVAWLVATGAWPYFREVFLEWNPNYVSDVFAELGNRVIYTFEAFRPWGVVHNLALPLAALALWEGRAWSRRAGPPKRVRGTPRVYAAAGTEPVADARVLLAALYLGWMVQAVGFQKGFEYVQVPVLLLGLAMIATQSWCVGFVYAVWFAFLAVLLNVTSLVPPHQWPAPGVPAVRLEHYGALTDPAVLKLWPRCWTEGNSPEMRNRTGQRIDIHCGVNWEQLDAVAKFLRTVEPPLGPGELNCWHDSTHSLYLALDVDPATRYMHYGTVFAIRSPGDWIRSRIVDEVRTSRQRYVVADLARMTEDRAVPHAPGEGGDPLALPAWFPPSERTKFPWNQRLVFRAGRYVVYQIVSPLGEIGVPDWDALPKPAGR